MASIEAAAAGGPFASPEAAGPGVDPGLSDPVKKCLKALEAAETDTEKFAALFLVPKLVKGVDCGKEARVHLVKAIGYSFLARMLRSEDSPDGCPKLLFQSVALSVLTCFSDDEEVMTHPSILFNLPVLLGIVANADSEAYEDNLMTVKDAYACLAGMAASEKGRSSLIAHRGIHFLCEAVVSQAFGYEDALRILVQLLGSGAHAQRCWTSYNAGAEDFDRLMRKLAKDFQAAKDLSKFQLCDTLRMVLRSYPGGRPAGGELAGPAEGPPAWLPELQRGLQDILFSRIAKEQRDPALLLVAAVVEVSDFDWCLDFRKRQLRHRSTSRDSDVVDNDDDNDDDGDNDDDCDADNEDGSKSRFFQIVCNLSCIEVIMQLDEGPAGLDSVLDNLEILVACYFIIESAVSHMIERDRLAFRQRLQLHSALENAFSAVIRFLKQISEQSGGPGDGEGRENLRRLRECSKTKYLVCATIRLLGAWLSEETSALRQDVYEILPFVVSMATETFEAQKTAKLRSLPQVSDEEDLADPEATGEATPDTLRFLLPALCHLVAEDKPRAKLIEMKLHDTLYTYLAYHWTIFDCFRKWLGKRWLLEEAAANPLENDDSAASFMVGRSKFEMSNSRHAMTTICNVLMNVAVLEPKLIQDEPIFYHVLRLIMNSLPALKNEGEMLVLYGNFSTLGLLILRHHSKRPKSTDFEIYKFFQAVIRFLWDAHNCEESLDEEELGVSSSYLQYWDDLSDLWFLGVQVLCALTCELPWVTEFIMETGWPQNLLDTFTKMPRGGLPQGSTKSSLEDLLCSLVKSGGQAVHQDLRKNNVIAVCQKHQLKSLATLISKSAGSSSTAANSSSSDSSTTLSTTPS